MKYDIVGDIHGHALRFIALLESLEYQCIDGVWQHPERILVSLGDIIDRGPEQRLIVDILMAMQQNNKAIVIMGNHEFYAIAWYLKDKKGNPLRPHNTKNFNEHRVFLEQVGDDNDWYHAAIDWFKTLPLFFETPLFRCVHAAWHDKHIATLQNFTDENAVILRKLWDSPESIDMSFYKALDYSLNGSKLRLPDGYSFVDSGGRVRTRARLKWWDVPLHNPTYRNSCTSVPNLLELPEIPIELANRPLIASDKPIFFGHYWMQGEPHLMKANIACLDWSVVIEGGVLTAYRFDGEQVLDPNKLVWL